MSNIRLDREREAVCLSEIEIISPIAFGVFDQCPDDEREALLRRVLHIGLLAVKEDRLSAFLAHTESELGVQLEHLKQIFDLKEQVFFQSTQKGTVAEEDVAAALEAYVQERGWSDTVALTGATAGELPRNKTGDLVCELEGSEGRRLVIECKFNKQIALGEIEDQDPFGNRRDTAWSQLLEARVNRQGSLGIIVFDRELVSSSISNAVDFIRLEPEVGFIVIVDSRKGDYRSLFAAYGLARQIALAARTVVLDDKVLSLIVTRLVGALREALNVRDLVEQNMENCREILRSVNKSLLLAEFCSEYLAEFLKTGTLNAKDLLAFYQGGDLRERFKPVEAEIEALGSGERVQAEGGAGGKIEEEVEEDEWGVKKARGIKSGVAKRPGRKCGKCGKPAFTGVKYCLECGTAIEE
jgi:hypothetical protein